ncbi:hypothetical protein [Microbacterium paludicola]|uniref:hypothetical protein n=1 Tax=Microbacterium paludicola TaxID=300019 RepID=UPI0009033E34|nr:hypothetical protein [Microbacterium paludicola]APF34647.1 hypothetical protein BO218_10980 [Microbacterium paludicola]
MGDTTNKTAEKRGPWFWEVVVYVVGGALTALGVFVWVVRANAEGEWSLRLSQLWDSIGLISLGLAIVAIGLTLTILRVQNRAADRAERETEERQAQHEEVLRRVEAIAEQTHVAVSETGVDVKDVKQLLGSQIESAQAASRSELEPEPATMTEAPSDALDELDDLSLEGVRDGDISNLPLDTHALADERLLVEVKTKEGVFYPVGAVPIGVLADVYDGWEAAYPDSKAQWKVGALVGAYRSYSAKALADGRQSLQGAPWYVTFRRSDDTLVTYYLSRTGRLRRGQTERTPVVKRLVGDGANARWVPLGETPDFT